MEVVVCVKGVTGDCVVIFVVECVTRGGGEV